MIGLYRIQKLMSTKISLIRKQILNFVSCYATKPHEALERTAEQCTVSAEFLSFPDAEAPTGNRVETAQIPVRKTAEIICFSALFSRERCSLFVFKGV